ncbi:methyl-accepting chemotaxis protein [Salinispirillum sp. LH 10-3-1]|uniref:Methyl-accepting chemotaxis protein n=1 Tax=Salinispirillum sp. LH 10-3-1 TaxID=2952525 RepID=A0AB38YG01_9GAMM
MSNPAVHAWRSLSFGVRLTLMMVTLILASIVLLTSLVFVQYQRAQVNASMAEIEARSETNSQSFTEWLIARQDEMRYLATVQYAVNLDLPSIASLMATLAEQGGFYDTIFVVGPNGVGQAGVSFENGRARIMPTSEANAFNVADRAWFRSAISGQDTFSQPVVSRATGATVSTVAIPIRRDGQIIAVMRGAVQVDTLVDRVAELSRDQGTEIYLLDGTGLAITPANSISDRSRPLTTRAAEAIQAETNFVGRYINAANTPVVGSTSYMPLLDWGLVVETRESVALAEVRQMLITLIVISSVVIAGASAICLAVIRTVTRTLGGDPNYAAKIVHQVSEGDLTADIHIQAGDTTSLLASIRTMQQNLRQMMTDIGSYSDQVAASSTELAQINEETEAGIQRQVQEISSSATAMNEMTATLEEVARNTQSTADASRSASDAAETGRIVVQSTIDAIRNLATEVDNATQVINEVKQDSDRIGSILQVIEAIAEQTNLLALNAAIEAARAGESGRGFAVVADEVRSLASRTKDSTTEIQAMIEKLQSGSDRAVKAMVVSTKGTETSVARATDTGEKLESIASAVAMIDQTAQQIASATEEQTAVSKDINKSIHNISDVSEQTAANVEQSTQASESLAKLAEQLKALVFHFKV